MTTTCQFGWVRCMPLNRAWHSRNQEESISEEQWASFSRFPTDIDPVDGA
jgi:hypothetical protein